MDSITVFGHFIFGLLIPLIIYDIKTKSEHTFRFMMKIKNFSGILKLIFGERVIFNNNEEYALLNTTKTGLHHIYEFYIKINYLNIKHKLNSNTVILDSFDMFNDAIYRNVKLTTDISKYLKIYKKLTKKYFKFHHTHKSKYELSKEENVLRKMVYYNKLIHQIIKYRPKIIKYLKSLSKSIMVIDSNAVILIKRKTINNYIANIDGGGYRFILNQEELECKLVEMFGKDLKIIYPEDYNFLEQFSIFSNAKIIIAQHGSAMANSFFTKTSSLIVEIAGAININNNWFLNQTKSFSQKYLHIPQLSMTKNEALTYFNSITYEDEITKKQVFQELNQLYTTNKYSNLKTIDKFFFPNCISTALNSGKIKISDLDKIHGLIN